MEHDKYICERNKWTAAIVGIALPGMGQVYNGELLKGFCFFSVFIMAPVIALKLTMCLPDPFLAIGLGITVILVLLIAFIAIAESYVTAQRHGKEHTLQPYNTWYFYLVVWMIGALFIGDGTYKYVRENIVQICTIASGSMEPAVLIGDWVIVDKTLYNHISPQKNDIIIHFFPDDRTKIYIKRIVGLPGETISVDRDKAAQVPHGAVYVVGDNHDHSIDSRTFGPIPLIDVIGRARQIAFSIGENGIRWDRISKTLGSSVSQ
jgi:signal peptidase I